jgi:XTP/dITP diphosphohydrolase
VTALQGRPGIYSARYSGEKATDQSNNEKLLMELEETGDGDRRAKYVCALALYDPENKSGEVVEGICEGRILKEGRGDGGFGYDPLFFLDALNKTFAEIPLEIKNKISHRGKALEKLKKVLQNLEEF